MLIYKKYNLGDGKRKAYDPDMTLTSSVDMPTSNPSRCTSAQCSALQSSEGKEHPRTSLCSMVSK
jgi:hypothetical protein